MFHQFKVDKRHQNLLRFQWWPDSDIKAAPVEFRITSSPGCANFTLKTVGTEHKEEFGDDVMSMSMMAQRVDYALTSSLPIQGKS